VTEVQIRNCSDEEVTEAFEYCLKLVPNTKGWERASILAAKVTYYIHVGKLQKARELLEDIRTDGFTFDSDLAHAERWLDIMEKQIP
jgi:hypothetical protein